MELGPVILELFWRHFLSGAGLSVSQWIRTATASAVCDKKIASDLLSFSIVRQTFAVYDADSAGFMSDAQLPLIGISAR